MTWAGARSHRRTVPEYWTDRRAASRSGPADSVVCGVGDVPHSARNVMADGLVNLSPGVPGGRPATGDDARRRAGFKALAVGMGTSAKYGGAPARRPPNEKAPAPQIRRSAEPAPLSSRLGSVDGLAVAFVFTTVGRGGRVGAGLRLGTAEVVERLVPDAGQGLEGVEGVGL